MQFVPVSVAIHSRDGLLSFAQSQLDTRRIGSPLQLLRDLLGPLRGHEIDAHDIKYE